MVCGFLITHSYTASTAKVSPASCVYSKGEPVELTRYHWYHADLSEVEAAQRLSSKNGNCFLVRQRARNLILSKKIKGVISHDIIHHSPEGYHLEGKKKDF